MKVLEPFGTIYITSEQTLDSMSRHPSSERQVGTNKKALHSQKRDSDLWVSQKWPKMIPKVCLFGGVGSSNSQRVQVQLVPFSFYLKN